MITLACATLILAGIAAVSAVISAYMACLTRSSIKQAQRHHEESVQPILFVDIYDHEGLRTSNFINPIPDITVSSSAGHNTSIIRRSVFLKIDAAISNLGQGAALNVSLEIKYEDNDGMILKSKQVGSFPSLGKKYIGTLEFHPNEKSYFLDTDGNFKIDEYFQLALKPWRLQIDYNDLYGNSYRTIHDKFDLDKWIKFAGRIDKKDAAAA